MKIRLINIKKQSPEIKFCAVLPTILYAKDVEDKKEIMNIFFIFLFWGVNFNFLKNDVMKKYVVCKVPISSYLTKGKEYEIIKETGHSYIVKRDDDSIDKVAKSRFYAPFFKS